MKSRTYKYLISKALALGCITAGLNYVAIKQNIPLVHFSILAILCYAVVFLPKYLSLTSVLLFATSIVFFKTPTIESIGVLGIALFLQLLIDAKRVKEKQLPEQKLPSPQQAVSTSQTPRTKAIPKNRISDVLLDNSPCAVVAVDRNLLITGTNRRFAELLNTLPEQLTNKRIDSIDRSHPWISEIIELITGTLKSSQQLKADKATYTSSSHQGKYLEISVIQDPNDRAASYGATEFLNIALIVYAEVLPDLRPFQAEPIQLSKFEVLGRNSIELNKEIKICLDTLIEYSSEAIKDLGSDIDSRGIALCQTTPGMNISVALRNIEKTAKESLEVIKQVDAWQKTVEGDVEPFDLGSNIALGITYLLKTQHFSSIPNIKFSFGGSNESICIACPQREGMRFLCYFLSLVGAVARATSAINITLGTETIDEEASSILVGLRPGVYARIIVEHSGQSFTLNMANKKYFKPIHNDEVATQLETALSLLRSQLSLLGGFVSLQSSPQRGTNITFYLPLNMSGGSLRSKKEHSSNSKNIDTASIPHELGSHSCGQRVLLVASDSDTLISTSETLKTLGLHVTIKQFDSLVAELNKPVNFEGLGFAVQDETWDSVKETSEMTKSLTDFDFLIISIDAASDTALMLVHFLEKQNPNATTLLLVDQSPAIKRMFANWQMIKKPLDLNAFANTIKLHQLAAPA
ncbi:MAG: hypothetical protein IT291_09630 [Deltaproteobacteria bacterium]|nr:hypothetical protein [Deltaproteobacteria bacterium]